MKTLITGCDLVDPQENRWVHGDLHEIGDTYVFNAVLDNRGQSNWSYEDWDSVITSRALILHPAVNFRFFERRGVLVIAKSDATLTDAAKEYIRG